MEAPEPHPLDFDWRFNAATAGRLVDLMAGRGPALCVGTPSVAALLEQGGFETTLVDRQPLQPVRAQVLADPSADAPLSASFSTALVDPPWYPEIYQRWLAWTAAHVIPSGELLASLWPPDTRPTASVERQESLEWIAAWADVEVEGAALRYAAPPFETAAMLTQGSAPADPEWRAGDLLRIRPLVTPEMPAPVVAGDAWVRFIFNDYQLALRLRGDNTRGPRLLAVPGAVGWIWPSVSRRAPGREKIDLWSSRNEVAIVEGCSDVLRQLRLIVLTGGGAVRNPESEVLRTLTRWQIPTGPYWRTLEWTHRA